MSHRNTALTFDKLNSYILDVQEWMLSCMFILTLIKQSLSSLDLVLSSRNWILTFLSGHLVIPCIQQLLYRTSKFSFDYHFRNSCNTCFIQMHDLRRLGQYLTDEATILAANVLVSSRLDYCSSLFRSLYIFNMCKLRIQNIFARIVM